MEHGILDYAHIFGLYRCRCGERFSDAVEMDRHLDTARRCSTCEALRSSEHE